MLDLRGILRSPHVEEFASKAASKIMVRPARRTTGAGRLDLVTSVLRKQSSAQRNGFAWDMQDQIRRASRRRACSPDAPLWPAEVFLHVRADRNCIRFALRPSAAVHVMLLDLARRPWPSPENLALARCVLISFQLCLCEGHKDKNLTIIDFLMLRSSPGHCTIFSTDIPLPFAQTSTVWSISLNQEVHCSKCKADSHIEQVQNGHKVGHLVALSKYEMLLQLTVLLPK